MPEFSYACCYLTHLGSWRQLCANFIPENHNGEKFAAKTKTYVHIVKGNMG